MTAEPAARHVPKGGAGLTIDRKRIAPDRRVVVRDPAAAVVHVARGEPAKAWADSSGIPARIVLAIGAQVMVTRNIPALNLFNGARGIAEAFLPDGAVVLRRPDGRRVAVRPVLVACESEPEELRATAMPLKLAYAMSIHKAQGVTLDAVEVDLGRTVFEAGQAYVALSRARSLACVRVLDARVLAAAAERARTRACDVSSCRPHGRCERRVRVWLIST